MADETRGRGAVEWSALRRHAAKRMPEAWQWCRVRLAAVARFLWRGPSYELDEQPGLWERLLSWRVRLAIVLATWLVAWMWIPTNAAAQLGWTLEYAGAVTISLVASLWGYLFIADLVTAIAWLVLTASLSPYAVRARPFWHWTSHIVEAANRQLAHLEAFLIWMGVLLPWSPRIDVQLPLLLGLALFGSTVLNVITVWRKPSVKLQSDELQSARRPWIYAFMLLGLLILLYRSRDQWITLMPLLIAFLLVVALRLCRHWVRKRHAKDHPTLVRAFRRRQRQVTRGLDVMLGPVLMLLSVVGVLGLSLWVRQSHDRLAREELDGPPPDPKTCVAEPGGPRPDLPMQSMFLVADSQIHALGGKRFPGQTELADVLVPAAVRPVELDMLGAASVYELRHAFAQVIDGAKPRPVFWAHLGDLADLSCVSELQRAVELFADFGQPHQGAKAELAGIAPGNHDMSFTGNFSWNPYWANACNSRRADKYASNQAIGTLLRSDRGVLAPQAKVSPPEPSRLSWVLGTGGLVTVTPLGTIEHDQQQRTVVAIFIDTGDDTVPNWGIAGLFGTYSDDQDRRLRAVIEAQRFADPVWIVFAHHPVAELTGPSRKRLVDTLAWLDGNLLDKQARRHREPDPRLLGVIAAHTHHAETHRMCIGRRVVREIVIGSTIDSAQQGALLEIGTDPRGLGAIRLRTVQTVARPGFTCGGGPEVVAAERCRQIVGKLKGDAACRPLFDEGPRAGRDCSELEQDTELGDALRSLIGSTGPVEPEGIWWAQHLRARRLLTCVCRGNGCDPDGRLAPLAAIEPLDDREFNRRIDTRLRGGDDAREELACLAWAASAQQQHKAQGMTFASALRCAFDDPSIPAEQETVANLDVQPCQ